MVVAAIAFTWFGLVLGISFLEAPLKFRAPGVTTQLGLGIGRVVFAALIAFRGKRGRVSPRRRTGLGAYGPVFHPDAVSGSVLWKRERK